MKITVDERLSGDKVGATEWRMMMAHISEQIADTLITDGWDDRVQDNGDTLFYKRLPTGGQIGQTLVTLQMDRTGRWLERFNGWGDIERDIDLRDYQDADAAIAKVLA